MTIAERRAHVARLYPGLSSPAIGRELGVSHWTVLQDLAALGISRQASGPRKRYPKAVARRCEACGREFTPRDDHADQRFCSRRCSDRGRLATPASAFVTRRERLEVTPVLYTVGYSYDEIARRFGVTAMTARADVTASGIRSRRPWRRPIHKQIAWKTCPHCGLEVWTYLSIDNDVCSQSCWALDRWRHGIGLEPVVAELERRGLFPPAKKQEWQGRWKLAEVGANGPGAKGRAKRDQVGALADEFLRQHPAAGTRRGRRLVYEYLMETLIGPESVFIDVGLRERRLSSDPVYKRAWKQVDRPLRRAARELDLPRLATFR